MTFQSIWPPDQLSAVGDKSLLLHNNRKELDAHEIDSRRLSSSLRSAGMESVSRLCGLSCLEIAASIERERKENWNQSR